MPASPEEKKFVAYAVDLMQSIGPVNAKAMFGGYGIFLKGLMFGLIADSILYLKADKETEEGFKAKGLGQFTYKIKGKELKMSYYQAPAEALEDGKEMNFWAADAYSAAVREASRKRRKHDNI